MTQADSDFGWVDFYMELAGKLVDYSDSRDELLGLVLPALEETRAPYRLTDTYVDGTTGPLRDICPFTLMGTFNRGISNANRMLIAGNLKKVLGLSATAPTGFDGIPVVSNFRTWFFEFDKDRQPGDIDALWQVFRVALELADSNFESTPEAFTTSFDAALGVKGTGVPNLTMGLFWIRPHSYVALDEKNREYIKKYFPHALADKARLTGAEYLELLGHIRSRLGEPDSPVATIPELSQAAWNYKTDDEPRPQTNGSTDSGGQEPEDITTGPIDYTIDSIVEDGCFLPRETLVRALDRLEAKKNLILQGPPGTGKTWLAKRLAYALIGRKDKDDYQRVRPIQFHANMSYEDFVRGYRPGLESRLELVNGPFMTLIDDAKADPSNKYIMVIEEINRGNPAQIFGEMLTLLEADKRNEGEGLQLAYTPPDKPSERVHIPENVYVIGTMNVADRSLALVDFALRRRFAFLDLEPEIGPVWRAWCADNCEVEDNFLTGIEGRIKALNQAIEDDTTLGKQFRVGHSVVTPAQGTPMNTAWFRDVVETEIKPLLTEYWYDAQGAKTVDEHVRNLVDGL